MEKFNNYEVKPEEVFENKKMALTNKVMTRLVLWGLIAFNPLGTEEAKGQNINTDNVDTPITMSSKVNSFENQFKDSGLLSPEKNEGNPVIVVTTKEDIEARYSDISGSENHRSSLSEELKIDFFEGGFRVVDRDTSSIKAIFDEVSLGDSGLVNPGEEAKLGNWSRSDYYVVNSVEDDHGIYTLKNEVLNMKNGESVSVFVETEDQNSEEVRRELFEKTKRIIEDDNLNKKDGQEK